MEAGMEVQPEPSKLRLELSTLPNRQKPQFELKVWTIEQISILAAAFGESITSARLRIYADDLLADLSSEQIQIAVTRARRELKFFPKLAELRELAGVSRPQDCNLVEADAAFQSVIRHLEHEGVMAGMRSLPPRVQYAVRQCGGLATFNRRLDQQSYPFLQRDFRESYQRAPIHDLMAPQLVGQFGIVRRLASSKTIPSLPPPQSQRVTAVFKQIPEPLSEAQVRDRREILKQQLRTLTQRLGTEQTSVSEGEGQVS